MGYRVDTTTDQACPRQGRRIHLGLAGFGISAWLTRELAEEGGRSGQARTARAQP
jgi:hypothetical protein